MEFTFAEAGVPHFFLESSIAAIALLIITGTIYYEILRVVWHFLPKLQGHPHLQFNTVMFAIFAGHIICIWIYALAYWLLVDVYPMGTLMGHEQNTFLGYLYFSASSYSSLGYGDLYPTGGLRMIAGAEVLNGLVLIGWSVTFTYFAMQQFWEMQNTRSDERRRKKLEKKD